MTVSLRLQVFLMGGLSRDDSLVAGLVGLRLGVHVLVRRYELLFVVSRSISNHDLRRILVGHHNCGLRKSISESIGMIGLKGLFDHTTMVVLTNLEVLSSHGSSLR